MAEGPGRMDTGEDVSTRPHQVYAMEAPEIIPLKVHKFKKDVLVLCTTNRTDIETAQTCVANLQKKGLVLDVMSHDHTQPSEAITETDKNTLIRALFESKKVLMIVSRHLAVSSFLGVQLDFIYKLSEQRKQPILIVYRLPDTDLSKFPRRLRSGTSLITIPKDKYTTKKTINHNDEDAPMELLNATKETQVKGFELQNVAPGLVCGFFHNYLEFKLPQLALAIREASKEMGKWNLHAQVPQDNIFTKMIILLPESCTFPSSFTDLRDTNIQYVVNTSLPDSPHVKARVTKDQGGQLGRDYSSSLCSITGNVLKRGGLEPITYVCAPEFATPLSNLEMMWKRSDLYGFSKDRKDAEYNEFIDNLGQILECFPECHDKYILLEYNDEAKDKIPISERIIKTIQEDIVRQENIGMVEEASRP